MELFKLWVQNKQGVFFSFLVVFFFSLLINSVHRKCVFEASKRLRFSLFIINQHCTPDVCYTTKKVFKTSDKLLFSLLHYFFNTRNTCSKQAGASF